MRCRLDGRLLARCATPLRLERLRPGRRVLRITARNAHGSRAVVLRFTVAAPARPRIAVTARPEADALARSARVEWTATGTVTRTTCAPSTGRRPRAAARPAPSPACGRAA